MVFTIYDDGKRFYEECAGLGLADEIVNDLYLLNCRNAANRPGKYTMASVKDTAGHVVLGAARTAPHNLTLCAVENLDIEAIHALAVGLAEQHEAIGGVIAEKTMAEAFAQAYSAASGCDVKLRANMCLYRLTQVTPPERVSGCLRRATEADLSFVPFWQTAFEQDCGIFISELTHIYETQKNILTNETGTYIWEDNGIPVATAASKRPMKKSVTVGAVYTPPYYRRNGYASACVAALSQKLLDGGHECCCLYTNLANPVSNSIYQKIGYRPVCDFLELSFVNA